MKIFVLTGAGISAESGMGTFRDKDGAWARFDPMKLASPEGFEADPDLVHAFYNARRQKLLTASPNPAHAALARLEDGLGARGGELFLCTQNIDDLHERAGSRHVLHMHGELRKARCMVCARVMPWDDDLGRDETCPACHSHGTLRPHIVWFGEVPLYMDDIQHALEDSDLFVSIGTSGSVYPAAGFVNEARYLGLRTCEINLEPSENAPAFEERYYGPASTAVPEWVDGVLKVLAARG
ncbi:NAD-dependent deacylase [Xanthobacter sp. TB0136]|uniref:NAD-dependent deacylase n=1 Tax=Xanthobacter sp. TB0136 TaxID=3459177 RepID=UPI004039478F